MYLNSLFRLPSNRIPYGSFLIIAAVILQHGHVSGAPLLDSLNVETPNLSTQNSGGSSELAPGVYIAPFGDLTGAKVDDSIDSEPTLVKSFNAAELEDLARYFEQDHSSTRVDAPDSIKYIEDPETAPVLIPYDTTPYTPLILSKDQLQSAESFSAQKDVDEITVVCDRNKIHPYLHYNNVVLPGLNRFWNGYYVAPKRILYLQYNGNFLFVCNMNERGGTFVWADAYRYFVDPLLQRECGNLVTGEVYYPMLREVVGRGVRGERVCLLEHRL